MRLRVDGAVICDCAFGSSFDTNFDDAIRRGFVDLIDESVGDIGKDDVVSRVVEEAGNKATA